MQNEKIIILFLIIFSFYLTNVQSIFHLTIHAWTHQNMDASFQRLW